MQEMWNRLRTSKTVKTAIGGMLVAIGSWMGDQIDTPALVTALIAGLLIIFMRDGVAKEQKTAIERVIEELRNRAPKA